MTDYETILDDVAAKLDRGYERHRDGDIIGHIGMGNPPKDMLDQNVAVTFPFQVYGSEFTVLAWKASRRNGYRLSTVLFKPGSDAMEIDDTNVRDLQYIETKHISSSNIADEEVRDDTVHVLSTALGYLTRKLLTGRQYEYYIHDTKTEPVITGP